MPASDGIANCSVDAVAVNDRRFGQPVWSRTKLKTSSM